MGINSKKKALADLTKDILGNVAVVGIGLALYEQKWWCLVVAVCSALIAGFIAWRSYD